MKEKKVTYWFVVKNSNSAKKLVVSAVIDLLHGIDIHCNLEMVDYDALDMYQDRERLRAEHGRLYKKLLELLEYDRDKVNRIMTGVQETE